MSARACGVSLNMPNRSPPPVTDPANAGSMSGIGKKSYSSSRAPAWLLKNCVMKVAWCRNRHCGGSAKRPLPLSSNLVVMTAALPPNELLTTSP